MSSISRKAELDGLRSLAVLPVLVAHAWGTLLPGGHRGVDIFFVLSGYLIAGLLTKEITAQSFSLSNFYRRRILRLMPAFFTVIFATILISWIVHTPDETAVTLKTAIFASLSASNLFLPSTGGYFSDQAEMNPLLHTWSLGVEEQFYLIFPLLLLAVLTWAPRLLLPVLVAISTISLIHSQALNSSASTWAHYSPLGRSWELLIGVLLATALAKPAQALKDRLSPGVLNTIAWTSMVGILFTYTQSAHGHEVIAQVAISLATAALIWSVVDRECTLTRILRWRALVGIGLISYSLYLWHQPVMAIARLFVQDASVIFLTGTILISLMLAALTYRFVEVPTRHIDWPFRRLFIGVLACVAIIGVVVVSGKNSGWFSARFDPEAIMAVVNDPATLYARACANWNVKTPQEISFCRVPATKPAPGEPATVAIWGDSHAMALSAGLIGQEHPYDLALYGIAGCALQGTKPIGPSTSALCFEKHEKALQDILADPTIKLVVITSKWTIPTNVPDGENAMREQLMQGLTAIKKSGRQVILVSAVPIYLQSIPQSLLRAQRIPASPIPHQSRDTFMSDTSRMIQQAIDSAKALDVPILHAADLLCPDGDCVSAQDGLPLYFDDDHLSVLGAKRVVQALNPMIDHALGRQPTTKPAHTQPTD